MNERIFENDIMNAFHVIMDYLPIIMDEPVTIMLTDGKTYKAIRSSEALEVDADESIGQPLDDQIMSLINKGEIFVGEYTTDITVPFKSYTIPIKGENGKIEGAVLLAKSLKRKRDFVGAFDDVKSSLEQITEAINDLNVNVQEVVDANEQILSIVEEANEKTADTNDILNFIQEISSQTNLLGLNAAIEAARAGEYGRGFDVVAKEIRKLSGSTSDSIKRVDSVLKGVSDSIKTIHTKVGNSNGVFEVQASSLEEIAASIEELNSSTQLMYGFMEKL
ncbi:methyl-accepting chemotaxis protein [Alkalibaculum sporogenes]